MTVHPAPGALIPLVDVQPGYLIQRPDGPHASHRLRVIARVTQETWEGRRRTVVCADGEVRADLIVRDGRQVRFVEDGAPGDRSEAAVWAIVAQDRAN